MSADNSTEIGKDELSKQRALLNQLVTWEHELAVLKELESDLEVEQISADVALKRATAKQDISISSADAEKIARARARKQKLESALEGGSAEASPSSVDMRADIERMRAGREALESWRNAPETVSAWRRPRVANTVLVIACAAALGAAMALHPVFLVLLVPLVMAIGYFTFTGQDADWVRVGAVRRFQSTRLKPPSSWERNPVDGRISEIDDATARLEQQLMEAEANKDDAPEVDDDAASELTLSMDLVEASNAYAAALAKAGIDAEATGKDFSRWLDLVHETVRISDELNQVRERRASLSREVEEARDAVFRFLALKDEAPPDGHADSEALRAGLERVAKRAS